MDDPPVAVIVFRMTISQMEPRPGVLSTLFEQLVVAATVAADAVGAPTTATMTRESVSSADARAARGRRISTPVAREFVAEEFGDASP